MRARFTGIRHSDFAAVTSLYQLSVRGDEGEVFTVCDAAWWNGASFKELDGVWSTLESAFASGARGRVAIEGSKVDGVLKFSWRMA